MHCRMFSRYSLGDNSIPLGSVVTIKNVFRHCPIFFGVGEGQQNPLSMRTT